MATPEGPPRHLAGTPRAKGGRSNSFCKGCAARQPPWPRASARTSLLGSSPVFPLLSISAGPQDISARLRHALVIVAIRTTVAEVTAFGTVVA